MAVVGTCRVPVTTLSYGGRTHAKVRWWDFAQKHSVKIAIDYDAVFEDLPPLWDMSGE